MSDPLRRAVEAEAMRVQPEPSEIIPRTLGERLALLPPFARDALFRGMDEDTVSAILFDWRGVWAREAQLPPAHSYDANGVQREWTHWGIIAGRGAGKTRSAGEFIKEEVEAGRMKRVALIGRTAADVRDTMIEGESGLLSLWPAKRRPKYQPSKRRIIFRSGRGVGARAFAYSSKEPNLLRGPQHDGYWGDEVAAWIYPTDTWDNLIFGLRLGDHPRGVFTTTPKPIKLLRKLLGHERNEPNPIADGSVVLAPRMSTYDNMSNLAESFIREVLTRYQGTRLGRQELMGEMLLDVPGALWSIALIDEHRIRADEARTRKLLRSMARIVVAVDPAVTAKEGSNETGIVVVGKDYQDPAHFYVFRDLSGRLPVKRWVRRTLSALRNYAADRVVGEVNNGGDLVEATLRAYSPDVPFRAVYASRGKARRAEPVSALYEQGRVHHVGTFDALEDQQITFVPGEEDEDSSPDRMDALVWGVTALMRGGQRSGTTHGGSFSVESFG
jgi:phage terminase large subunit-like protein